MRGVHQALALVVAAGVAAGCVLRVEVTEQPPDGAIAAAGPDAATADAAALGVCSGPFAGAIACDDFESGDLAHWPSVDVSGADVQVTGELAHRGVNAASIATLGPGGIGAIGAGIPPLTDGTLFARVWIHVPGGQSFPLTELFTLGPSGPHIHLALVADRPAILGLDGSTAKAADPLPVDRWVCLRVEVDVSPVAGAIRLYQDDTLVASEVDTPNVGPSGATEIWFGAIFTDSTQPAISFAIDDIAAATFPIPCTADGFEP